MTELEHVVVRFKQRTFIGGGQVAHKGSVHRIPKRDLHADFHEEVPDDTPLSDPLSIDDWDPNDGPEPEKEPKP